jgi:hypothetical protein
MIGMCLAALPVAIMRSQAINVAASSFTLYLVTTAWLTAQRRENEVGALETLAFLCGSALAIGALGYSTTVGKGAAPFFYGFGGLAAFAAVLDLKVIMQGGIKGAPRISRHLWRMSFAMFIATGSFFLGQQKVMPDWMRGSQLLFMPVILVLGSMIFWLIRVRFSSERKS